jgi:Fe-S-cluster containining protein
MAENELQNWEKRSAENHKKYKQFLQRPDKKKILKILPELHEQAFEKVDCLSCGNCCKGYSPRFKSPDIKRISKVLKMKEGEFTDKYLLIDNEGDYVARQAPCPFLGEDNFCSIYEDRPSDCVRFPYTDEDIIFKRPQLTLKNITFCPIVFYVMEGLTKQLGR